MMLRGDDGELREYEIVSTRERESVFQRACPVIPVPLAIICCLLNILPGLYSWSSKHMIKLAILGLTVVSQKVGRDPFWVVGNYFLVAKTSLIVL